ncbi:MAG: aspartate aminotransferase, partial [Clostridia bacterium]|nr:aspartate aminotransferase [Clostridia bacterium]
TFDDRRKYMGERRAGIKGITYSVPGGAFYVFVGVSSYFGKKYGETVIDGSLTFSKCALKEGVAVIPGVAFGFDGAIRLSYAINKDDICEGLTRIENFLKKIV